MIFVLSKFFSEGIILFKDLLVFLLIIFLSLIFFSIIFFLIKFFSYYIKRIFNNVLLTINLLKNRLLSNHLLNILSELNKLNVLDIFNILKKVLKDNFKINFIFLKKIDLKRNIIRKINMVKSNIKNIFYKKKQVFILFYMIFFFLFFIILNNYSFAIPPLPAEFYGSIIDHGRPAPLYSNIDITFNGESCSIPFKTDVYGYFGLITCPLDDPSTDIIEGPSPGDTIEVKYNGYPTVILNNYTLTSGGFIFLNVSYPVPFCGDAFCDPFFENLENCFEDCFVNATTNTTINNTAPINNTEEGNGTEEGNDNTLGNPNGGESSSKGGGGGGGGGAFSSASNFGSAGSFEFACVEDWVCSDWGPCNINNLQYRNCTDLNNCGTTENKPPEVQDCIYVPSCFNGIQDGDETGVDCGGSCKPCPSCTNGIQDCYLINGTQICEEGIDCGGPCRPCDSCFNGIQDWTETGVDCGGLYCKPCPKEPVFEAPKFFCEKSFNPFTNGGKYLLLAWFFIFLIASYYYADRLARIRKRDDKLKYKGKKLNDLNDLEKAKLFFDTRKKAILFLLLLTIFFFLFYLIYYEFLLCEFNYESLWWLFFLIILFGLLCYKLWSFLEYNEMEKLKLKGYVEIQHQETIDKLLSFENEQILTVESEIKGLLEKIAKNNSIKELLFKFPDLKEIYKDIIRLFELYQKNKTPMGIEKKLCDKVYAIETNDSFKELAGKVPLIWLLYKKLRLLYEHYEAKQKLYDELAKIKEELNKKVSFADK